MFLHIIKFRGRIVSWQYDINWLLRDPSQQNLKGALPGMRKIAYRLVKPGTIKISISILKMIVRNFQTSNERIEST
jgi:hypothetical protein